MSLEIPACNRREDSVDKLVKDLTAEEIVAWMVEYHGLPESSVKTVVSNLKDALHYHRLRGRLDKWPAWAALAELILRKGDEMTELDLRLVPTERFLIFHPSYCAAFEASWADNCMGCYCNGWEL